LQKEVLALYISICDDDKAAQERLTEIIKDWACDRNVEVELAHCDSAETFTMSWPDVPCNLAFETVVVFPIFS